MVFLTTSSVESESCIFCVFSDFPVQILNEIYSIDIFLISSGDWKETVSISFPCTHICVDD